MEIITKTQVIEYLKKDPKKNVKELVMLETLPARIKIERISDLIHGRQYYKYTKAQLQGIAVECKDVNSELTRQFFFASQNMKEHPQLLEIYRDEIFVFVDYVDRIEKNINERIEYSRYHIPEDKPQGISKEDLIIQIDKSIEKGIKYILETMDARMRKYFSSYAPILPNAFYTIHDIMARFKVSQSTVNKWRKEGKLVPFVEGKSALRFKGSDIENFIKTQNKYKL